MSALLDATLDHLRALVGFDTRNPPRTIDPAGIFGYLRERLPGFEITLTDHGGGAISLYAVRGRPRLLFNVHLDTVPDAARWRTDPFQLRVAGGRAVGLGACDIKGAAAALLAVAGASAGPLALLFTSDEEGAAPRCVRAFLTQHPTFAGVLVAEPTRSEAVFVHRGIRSVRVQFAGHAGHASAQQRPEDSALHQAVRWCNAALDHVDAQAAQEFGGLTGLRFNLGRIEGGVKPNVIAADTEVRFGMRPLPSTDVDELLERLRGLTEPGPAVFEETFRGPPLPAITARADALMADARGLAGELGLALGAPVDFWTEAALFSEAGYPALVWGPGAIAQAHAADEWVALAQLQTYAETVQRVVAGGQA